MPFYRNSDSTITTEVEASVIPDGDGFVVVLRSYGQVEREGMASTEDEGVDMLAEWFATMPVEDLPGDASGA